MKLLCWRSRKFILVLVDLSTHKLVGWLPLGYGDRKKSGCDNGRNLESQIEEVSMDTTGNYSNRQDG